MNIPLDPAAKKAYEVSYALLRVAALLPSRSFALTLERQAVELLETTIGNLPEEAERILRTLKYVVALSRDTGNMHMENADLLITQMDALATLLREMERNEITPADLDDIFSGNDSAYSEGDFRSESEGSEEAAKSAASEEGAANEASETAKATADLTAGERQAIILGKIRQSGNCRTRDLQAILPDLSERTLRYDLQRLMEQGRIERGGGGGPASWYRIAG